MCGLLYPQSLEPSQVQALTPKDAITAFRILWLWIRESGLRTAAELGRPDELETCTLMALKERITDGGYSPLAHGAPASRLPPYTDANGGNDGLRILRENQFRVDWECTERAIDELPQPTSFARAERGQRPLAVASGDHEGDGRRLAAVQARMAAALAAYGTLEE